MQLHNRNELCEKTRGGVWAKGNGGGGLRLGCIQHRSVIKW